MGNVLPPNNSVVTSKLTAEGQISAFLTDLVELSLASLLITWKKFLQESVDHPTNIELPEA